MPDTKRFCDLSGHVAVVTGASGGIGSAVALELAHAGAAVAVHYNKRKELAGETAEKIKALGGRAQIFRCNFGNLDEIPSLVSSVAEELGPPDILINNAGMNLEGFLVRITQDEVNELFTVNLISTFFLSKECAKYMLKAKWGRLVFISSPASVAGSPGQAAYAASKSGLHGFSRSLSVELGMRNITSNVVIPGIVETAMLDSLTDKRRGQLLDRIPLKRFAQPDEVARFVRFIVSEEAAYLNGQELHFNGGGVVY